MSTKPTCYTNTSVPNFNKSDIQSYIRLILFQDPTTVFEYLILQNRLEDTNFNSYLSDNSSIKTKQ